jgi:hypothetical protein
MLLDKPKKENVLVCIGYSFPFINEIFDRQIIKKLKPQKIYFQNPIEDVVVLDQLKERFNLYNPKSKSDDFFKHIKDVSRFFIPNELTNSDQKGIIKLGRI